MRGIQKLATFAIVLSALAAGCGSAGGDSPYSVGEEISIRVQPGSVVFSAPRTGESTPQLITVQHSGKSGTLIAAHVSLDPATETEFRLCTTGSDVNTCQPPAAMYLQATEQAQFVLYYSPVDIEPDSATLVIEHNATNEDALTHNGVTRIPISTMTPNAMVYVTPTLLNFGPVAEGQSSMLEATLINDGTKAATVTGIDFSNSTSDDFSFTPAATVPMQLEPGDRRGIFVTYAPMPNVSAENLVDNGRVEISYTEEGEQDPRELEVQLQGYLTAPEITVLPGAVNFGWVLLDQHYELALTLRNDGTQPLSIEDIAVSDLSNPYIGLANLPTLPLQLAAREPDALFGGSTMVLVTFEATEPFPLSTDPIGSIVIRSNDRDEQMLAVPVYARLEAPAMLATPADLIDFGVVPLYETRNRQLTLFNAGQADLWVDSVELTENPTGEFSLRPQAGFAPLSDAPEAGVIPAGTAVTMLLDFVNQGPDHGEQWGNVHIRSNDPTTPELDIALKATRTGAPVCQARLNPSVLDFGIVPHGAQKDLVFNIESYGSGHCSFRSSVIGACGGLPIPGFGASCSTDSTSNQHFAVTAQPIPTPMGLQSGTSTPIHVTFTPPENVPLIPDFDVYYGLFHVTLYDPYIPACTVDGDCPNGEYCLGGHCAFDLPNLSGATTSQPNLAARSGVSDISVLPEQLDFGLVTIGCVSQTMTVTVYNTGTAPLQMSNIYLQNCGPEFELKSVPPLPADVSSNQPLVVQVVYIPQNEGPDQCTLFVESSDQDTPTFTVPLLGEGTYEVHHVDVFTQISGQNVDILFVVDNSGSMCEEQDRLSSNMDAFIQHAQQWGNSYQIGVISVCVNAEQCDGPGLLKTQFGAAERWVEPSTWSNFTSNVEIGCDGNSDWQEAGLEAARKALTLPINHTSSTPCTADSDCQAPDTCMEWHGQKRCGGWNAGFLRDDAALEIVALSDEEDQSTPTPDFYVDFFHSIKGFANENLFHFHSIVGDEGGGCGDENSGTTTADAGDRYIYVSEQTGGVVESICNDSFADALSEIGNIAFGLKRQFFLQRVAEPSTITVSVRGVTCTYGWEYNQPSNSIIFQGQQSDTDPCRLPQPGDEIVAEYDAICFTD